MVWRGVIAEYSAFLPITSSTPPLTLSEGNTPLIKAGYLSDLLGLEVYLKYEGMNPTGSFKDRGMVVAVAKALEEGAQAIICASTGNTSAAAAAYAAKCGIRCNVVVPAGNIAMGKLAQALIYGARVIAVQGNFDTALEIVRDIARDYPVTLVNSVNPFRIEGQQTAAFEICDGLGKAPDFLAIPVGNAGNITAYWKGFQRYFRDGIVTNVPRMLGFQAQGSAPIVHGYPIEDPQTIASAIRIGNPASWQGALNAVNESGGYINMVSDQEILSAYSMLASREGVFVEPASAASVAGLIKAGQDGRLESCKTAVCVLTGHGLKDPHVAVNQVAEPAAIPAELKTVLNRILD